MGGLFLYCITNSNVRKTIQEMMTFFQNLHDVIN
jgi:hypothetical protein